MGIFHSTIVLAQNMKIVSTRTLPVYLEKKWGSNGIFEYLNNLKSFEEALIFRKHTGLLNTQVFLSKIPYVGNQRKHL